MPSIIVTLKQDSRGDWYLYAPKGHILTGPFRGNEFEANAWSQAWISCFHNWTIEVENNN